MSHKELKSISENKTLPNETISIAQKMLKSSFLNLRGCMISSNIISFIQIFAFLFE